MEWEELSFSLNGATWTTNRPPFPLVQPEKVLSLPLDLRLNQDYTYRLDGVETVSLSGDLARARDDLEDLGRRLAA